MGCPLFVWLERQQRVLVARQGCDQGGHTFEDVVGATVNGVSSSWCALAVPALSSSAAAGGGRVALALSFGARPPVPDGLVEAIRPLIPWDFLEYEEGFVSFLKLYHAVGRGASLDELARDMAWCELGGRRSARGGYEPERRVRFTGGRPPQPAPDTPRGKAVRRPDLGRLKGHQGCAADESGAFVEPGVGVKGALRGHAEAALFEAQRGIIRHMSALGERDIAVFARAISKAPAAVKVDEAGSAVPFALTLCEYLAHCSRVGGLAYTDIPTGDVLPSLRKEDFYPFFLELNGWIKAEAKESRAERNLCWQCGDGRGVHCWNGGCEMCDYGATTVYEPWGEVGESGDEGGYGSDVGYGGACSGYSDGEL